MSNDDYDFKVNEHLVPYLINGDNDHLEYEEAEQADRFLDELHIDHVELLYNGEDLDKSFTQCDITGSWCMAVRVRCFAYLDSHLQRIQ